jgi:YegS/Rv2252/BmrU family lipid kinase
MQYNEMRIAKKKVSAMKCIIVNPVAGHGKAKKSVPLIENLLKDSQFLYTNAPGHATVLAREAALSGKYDAVVAMGGDGTVSEVAAGLRDTNIPLGILPAGTGNDTCRGYGIEMELKKAAEVLRTGIVRGVDILKVNGRIYLNIISAGFDAHVVQAGQRYKSLGSISYAIGVYAALAHYRYTDLHLTMDGDTRHQQYYLVATGCGTHYGGGMKVLPAADPCDGWLDVCAIDPVSVGIVLRLLPKFIKGQHGQFNFVHFFKARHVIYEAPDGQPGFDYNADGEIHTNERRVEITIIPAGQQVILPSPL